MDKWKIISTLSSIGTHWLDRLLDYYGANSTREITENQAQEFYKNFILEKGRN